jgi:gas vesicle protein
MRDFFIGLGIGAGIGILIAPRSGEETRELIRSRAHGVWSRARHKTEDLRQATPINSVVDALNSIGRDRLMAIYGVGPATADKIIQNRPYDAVEELLQQGIVPESTFESLHIELLKFTA